MIKPATANLIRQSRSLRVHNQGPLKAVVMAVLDGIPTYWDIEPGTSFDIHSSFPEAIFIAGNVEMEVLP